MSGDRSSVRRRWLFVGQLGSVFDDGGPILLIEARSVFARAPMHRAKAHLLLSALRHRAAELGERAEFHQVERYSDVVDGRDDLEVIDPTSWRARRYVRRHEIPVLPSRGFVMPEAEFTEWAAGRRGRLLMEDFYRRNRARTGLLMEGDQPAGGRWNFDEDNREPPPRGAARLGLPAPWWPEEDDIDREVRADLDRWQAEGRVNLVGDDGPRRFAATESEARLALEDFVGTRLPDFGPYEDAMLSGDWTMSHSLLSAPMNLGLLDPLEVARRVEREYESGGVPLQSAEGYIRQVIGWRDYMWNLYWHLGERYPTSNNVFRADHPVPEAYRELDPSAVEANCVSETLDDLRRHGWAHHIQRLMVLGNWALQRGVRPDRLSDWFVGMFVDGTPWVMPANVVGMSQHADGGIVATKPYVAAGAYVNRMSDYCGGCRFTPSHRVGETACPMTTGYWSFLRRHERLLAGNPRMRRQLLGLGRLADLDEVVEEFERSGR